MKDQIIKAIGEYVNEPQDKYPHYEIRSVPSPDVLADWIMDAIAPVTDF